MTDFPAEQVSFADLGIWSGRTSPERSVQTKEKTSRPSSRKSSKSQNLTLPTCLCLKRASGPNQDGSTMSWEDGAWPGESMTLSSGAFRSDESGLLWLRTSTYSQPPKYCLTLNIGEKPREPNPTKLSQVLEQNPDPKYNLSATACQGILRRAEKRGKELPPELKAALTAQSVCKETESTEATQPDATGVDGAGGGSYTLNTIDRPAVVSFQERAGKPGGAKESSYKLNEQEPCQPSTTSPSCMNPWDSQSERVYKDNEPWHSLNANNRGGQNRDAVLTQCIQQNASGEVRTSDVCYTVTTNSNASGRNTPMLCFDPRSQDGVPRVYENETVPTLNTAGGGQRQTCVIEAAAVDVRNGRENSCVNGTLQAIGQGFNYNSNNVVRTPKSGR